ncbi:MAG: dihydroorotate dehydrogenase electron transfer subunit [candidate division Zixibacteria bacterium]|jgi:dihydroorotate dehydrogenase electron transfer subunit|nr:dihydroorotate dehydrogenase electron transfer subunit [candidate division Zixibacteria bacterium]
MSKIVSEEAVITRRRDLHNNYYSLTFGPIHSLSACRPGNFVHIKLPTSDIYFRRAMSVAAVYPDTNELEIIFRVFGRGTTRLATFRTGDTLDVLGPLGKGFAKPRKSDRVICVAGGIGFPPLFYLASDLVQAGFDPKKIEFFYGGRSAPDIIERSRIKKLGLNFYPVTEDGSVGRTGLVTQFVRDMIENGRKEKFVLYGCGPEGMLRATNQIGLDLSVPGELAFEAPMPCGIGVCLGCVVPLVKGGYARVCADGPVFKIGEVVL